MNTFKTLKSYAFYTFLCLCSFAFMHSIIWWISKKLSITAKYKRSCVLIKRKYERKNN